MPKLAQFRPGMEIEKAKECFIKENSHMDIKFEGANMYIRRKGKDEPYTVVEVPFLKNEQ